MSGFEQGVDVELRADFIDESLDGLQRVSALLVELEANPDRAETVQAIFRPIHSIKGNSAYFGLFRTKELAHELESILDLVRKGGLAPDSSVVGALLQGVDDLGAMLGRARSGQAEVVDEGAFGKLLEGVRGLASSEKSGDEESWRGLLRQLRAMDAPAALGLAERLARGTPAGRGALGQGGEAAAATGHWPAAARQMAERLADLAATPDAGEMRKLLGECLALAAGPEAKAHAAKAQSDFEVLARTVGLGDPVARSVLPKRLAALFPAPAEAKPQAQAKTGKPETASAAAQESKTMRVPEERIDAFLAHVGELVTLNEMYGHLHTSLAAGADGHAAATELRRINEAFGHLSLSLQHSIMQIRKVSVGAILGKIPRMVRDIAESKGKRIETRVEGADILVDKSLVDALDAPLTHMVRNAADHGIEPVGQRAAAGKPERGTISVAVSETADEIVLEVGDDGKGIDRRALAEKAEKLGLVANAASLSDTEALQMLFASGVSTAKEVTDVSGRGVGMDVVKRAVDGMGGRIEIASKMGEGTEVRVRLPKTVTTQILDGFVVAQGGARYVFPLKSVKRCFRPAQADLATVQGKGTCVRNGEKLLRVMSLAEQLGFRAASGDAPNYREGIMVVLEGSAQTVAVHVDGIDGVRRVVLKDIAGVGQEDGSLVGGAIMGDGTVALVLDVDALAGCGAGGTAKS